MLALARELSRDLELKNVPGICFMDGGRITETKPAPQQEELDVFPSPYLEDVIDVTGKSRVILLSSRGCTSPCTFCYTTRASKHRVRFHSTNRIISELRHLKAKGIRDFWFADPNFAHAQKRLTSLLKAIIEQVPDIRFWCQTRYNLIDRDILDLLKRAGAHTIAFGLESADRQVLKRIKKGLDPSGLSDVVAQVQSAGIEVELFTLFGLPGETLARANATLDFVKSNGVTIDGNSISQQLHLFFGTPISDAPADHGIKPLSLTKPAYQSICRDYETDAMNEEQIRRMSLHWRLNRKDFTEDVQSGDNLFTVAGFITSNYRLLADRPEADLLLAKIYLALEEYDAAHESMRRLVEKYPHVPEVRRFLAGPFIGFKAKRRGIAGPGWKVIYDCQGFLDGRMVPTTVGFYQDTVLGGKRLLADIEQGLTGMRAGGVKQLEAVFPDDYGNRELAGKTVMFQLYLHLAMEPYIGRNMAEFFERPPGNIYRFHDLDALRKHNGNLYYLVLKDSVFRDLAYNLTDIISLLNFNLKLGFHEKAKSILARLPMDENLQAHVGRVFLANGLPEEAYRILSSAGERNKDVAVDRAKALIKMKRYQEAEAIVADASLSGDIMALDLRVGLASLLAYPTAIYLERMDDLIEHQVKMMIDPP